MKRFAKVMALFAVFLLTLYVFDKLQPTITTATKATQPTPITTYAVYEVRQLQWTFDDPSDYSYDESLINLSGGEAKLRLQTILKELKNQTPLTIPFKGDGSDGEYKNKHEFESAAYSYKGTLKTLSFSADEPSQTSVRLKIRAAASQQALEGAEWQPKGKEYYTTSPQDMAGIAGVTGEPSGYVQYKAVLETDDDARTPTLNSVTITYETQEYPVEAAISTKDYVFGRSVEVQALATEEELKGQTVKYEYSADSGNSWKEPVEGQILAAAAGKIAVKATLGSNGAETPVAKDVKLSYRISVCDENWQANYTGCGKDDTRTKYYTDTNNCGSTEGLPADNGTTESCNYCTSEWANVNSSCRSDDTIAMNYFYTNSCCDETRLQSDCTIPANTTAACDYCTPLWQEVNESCGKDDKIVAVFADANNCYAKTGFASDNLKPQNKTYSCDYCAPSFACGSYGGCSENNQKTCVQVNDANNCYSQTGLLSDNYSGDFSEFTASCAYDNEKPSVNSAIAAAIGNTLTVMANITDKSPTTAVAHVIKDNNAVMNLTLTNTNAASGGASDIYTASANAAELEGAYIVSIFAKDSYGNTELAKGIAGLTINAEKSAMKEIVLNSTGKALIVLANSATIEVKGKAEPTEASATGRIVVAEQTTDVRNTTKPQERKELGKYIEIEADEALKSNVSSATLKISYSDEEVAAANVSEASLAIYYYDKPSLLWQLLNSTANAALNYVEGNTTHLSLFGVFGNVQNQTTAANATANATINQTINATTNQTANETAQQQQQTVTETPAEAKTEEAGGAGAASGAAGAAGKAKSETKPSGKEMAEAAAAGTEAAEGCTYDVSIVLAGKPSFVNATQVNAMLTNIGTCSLHDVEVKAAPPLDSYVTVEDGKASQLQAGESFTFAVKLKATAKAAAQQVQGFAVKEPRKATTKAGKIVVTGKGVKGLGLEIESGVQQFSEEMPLSIEVYELEQNGSKSSIAATAIGILVLITLLGMLYSRVRQGKKDGGSSSKNSENKASGPTAAINGEEKAAVEKNLQEQQHEQEKGTPGFEEGLKRFEEKWKEQQQNVAAEKGSEKSLEGFRETFK